MALDFSLLNTNVPATAGGSFMAGATQANALASAKLKNQADEMAMQNALAEQQVYRQGGSLDEISNKLMGAGLGKQAVSLKKEIGGMGETAAKTTKLGLEATELGGKIDAQEYKKEQEILKNLSFNPSSQNVAAHLQDQVKNGKITDVQAQAAYNKAMAFPDDQRSNYFLEMSMEADKIYSGRETYRKNIATEKQAAATAAEIARRNAEANATALRGQNMTQFTALRGQDLTNQRALDEQASRYNPTLQSKIEEAKAYGQGLGKNRIVAELALPSALQAAEDGIRLIDEMVGKAEVKDKNGKIIKKGTKPHPGFADYVGATLMPGLRFAEGSEVASFEGRQKQIEGKAFLEAFQTLKGGGAITEKEGAKATAAIMRMNKASSEKEYIAAARELQEVLKVGMERAKAKAGGGKATVAPNATPPSIDALLDKYKD